MVKLCNITEKTHWLLLKVIIHGSHISQSSLLSLIISNLDSFISIVEVGVKSLLIWGYILSCCE